MDAISSGQRPPSVTAVAVGRIVAFLVVLALTAAGGWQAGRILEPPPLPAPLPAGTFIHDHP